MYNMFNMYSFSMSRWSENPVHNKSTAPSKPYPRTHSLLSKIIARPSFPTVYFGAETAQPKTHGTNCTCHLFVEISLFSFFRNLYTFFLWPSLPNNLHRPLHTVSRHALLPPRSPATVLKNPRHCCRGFLFHRSPRYSVCPRQMDTPNSPNRSHCP